MGGVRIHNYRGLMEKIKMNNPREIDAGMVDKTFNPR
jgi:hypothetical protein